MANLLLSFLLHIFQEKGYHTFTTLLPQKRFTTVNFERFTTPLPHLYHALTTERFTTTFIATFLGGKNHFTTRFPTECWRIFWTTSQRLKFPVGSWAALWIQWSCGRGLIAPHFRVSVPYVWGRPCTGYMIYAVHVNVNIGKSQSKCVPGWTVWQFGGLGGWLSRPEHRPHRKMQIRQQDQN